MMLDDLQFKRDGLLPRGAGFSQPGLPLQSGLSVGAAEHAVALHGGVAWRRILAAFAMALLVFLMLGATACHRLDPSQDATTIQGEWQVSGANMTFVITANQFKLPGGTSYDYTIDVGAKKVNFGVGNVTGSAGYQMEYNGDKQIILTLTEVLDGQETTTTFIKLSDNTAATPVITNATPEPAEGAGGTDGAADTGEGSGS